MLLANFDYREGVLDTVFQPEYNCQDIDTLRVTTLVYEQVPPEEFKDVNPEQQDQNYKTFEVLFMKQEKHGKLISGTTMRRIYPRFEKLNIDMNILELKKLIYSKVRFLYKEAQQNIEDEEWINQNILIHVYDNLPMEKTSKYSQKRAVCDFCFERHG